MTKDAPDILWLDELGDHSTSRAGAKIARLGELRRTGTIVPDGFVVTTRAFERFLEETGASRVVCEAMKMAAEDRALLSEASRRARAAIAETELPRSMQELVVDAYDELSYRYRDLNIPVAVRSSATGEDASEASFAGQFDTYLGVTGPKRLVESVRRCWASLFTERAVGYRLDKGLDYASSPMAVGVLKLVHARASGVAFSVHPVTGNAHRMVVEASWGWGEAVVQGLVTPDHVEIGKSDGRILDYQIADKKVVSAFDYALGAVVEHEMPRRLRTERCLDDEEIQAVFAAVVGIEAHYGYPVDVEWVVDRDRRVGEPITIVQSRPVTVTEAKEAVPAWNPVAYAQKYAFNRPRS